jgi:hypothetical protein
LRKTLIAAFMLLATMFLAACGDQQSTSPVPTQPGSTQGAPTPAGKFARAVIANSELVVGENRFVLGLLDTQTGQPINYVPEVGVQFFKVNADETATKIGDGQVVYHSENLPAGLYVSRFTFAEAGNWGVVVTVKPRDAEAYQQRLNFTVVADSSVPLVGEPAPRSKNQTVHDAAIDEICSAVPHDDMHEMTIADAVTSGKPTVILIAAPGFCPSFTCGPDLEMTQKLKAKYGDKANFVHIEAPNEIQSHTHTGPVDPNHNQEEGHRGVAKPQVQTAQEWGLKSEPWLFLVDKNGNIADRFEGGLTIQEVEPALVKILE